MPGTLLEPIGCSTVPIQRSACATRLSTVVTTPPRAEEGRPPAGGCRSAPATRPRHVALRPRPRPAGCGVPLPRGSSASLLQLVVQSVDVPVQQLVLGLEPFDVVCCVFEVACRLGVSARHDAQSFGEGHRRATRRSSTVTPAAAASLSSTSSCLALRSFSAFSRFSASAASFSTCLSSFALRGSTVVLPVAQSTTSLSMSVHPVEGDGRPNHEIAGRKNERQSVDC